MDFDGNERDWTIRGAYTNVGAPDWDLALEIRPEVMDMTTHVYSPLEQQEHEFFIFPNPAKDKVYVRFEKPVVPPIEIKVMDVNNKIVQSFYFIEPNSAVDLSNLNAGIYFISVMTEHKIIGTKKIIVFR